VVFTARDAQAAPPRPANGRRRVLYYRAPMSADTSPVPKKDPMGMDYIPVYADGALTVPGAVRLSPERVQRAGVRVEAVQRRNLSQVVRAAGTVDHDESRLAIVTSKFSGFVEKLFVSVTGAEVHPGQPLARVWIESNDILAKEADYLIALRGIGEPGDVKRAENNLRLFGVPESMIQELKRTKQPVRSITLTSPRHGIVIEKPAIPGMRFAAGDILFKVADHSVVWIIAQVPERDLATLRVGETAHIKLTAYADTPFEGRIAFISPQLDMATRTVQVRIEVANPGGRIKIGQYADVAIDAPSSGAAVIAIPESAIIDSGTRQVVFVAKEDGVFEPRTLILGRRAGGYVEVRQGLAEGEKIVSSGNFLIDAESNLQTALSAFTLSGNAQ
jgi:Cu(I)/Ag(I) efflux system membrane fusion protein